MASSRLHRSSVAAPRFTPLALALGCAWAAAQVPPPLPAASAAQSNDVVLEADQVGGRPDLEATAEGNVLLQRGPVRVNADRVRYDIPAGLARASGRVRIERGGDRFAGTELQLQLDRFEGYFLEPEYFFALTGAGGRAERIDFLDSQRSRLYGATYSSCPADGSGGPAWLLTTRRVKLDFEANEGIAEGAVLRFYGVPILAAPVLSFPLTEERKSGWLPPTLNIDNKAGVEIAVPYYWNIAPNRDATLAPLVATRRGAGLQSEFRYLQGDQRGELNLDVLPNDRVLDRSRHQFQFDLEGDVGRGVHYRAQGAHVSDDEYWKDFSRPAGILTPRLLPQDLLADRRFSAPGIEATAYARVQHWQVLQAVDAPILPPYQRSPQLGLRGLGELPGGLAFGFETEVNRFTRVDDPPGNLDTLPEGTRWHAVGSIARPWRAPGWWFTPKLALNLASYRTEQPMEDGRTDATRSIPTASVDGGLVFERNARWLGRPMRQTLEPRVLYLNTPFREQQALPVFDTAGKDFNLVSVFSDNAFSGVDRVSDAHQVTAGVTTRLLERDSGAEALRLGLAQRYLLRDQRITANPDGTPDGPAFTRRFSDLLAFGSAALSPRWTLDAAVQYSPDLDRVTRSVLSARFSPGPFRTLSTSYRFTRELSEQVELGWQWPLYRGAPEGARPAGACSGNLYGVGRVNYSTRDSRITDSLVGFEYDAGCWIGRIVAERLSTGRSEATSRLLLQLELVGLSRLGSNPLQVLKDNVPGYRLLREEPGDPRPSPYE